MLLQNFAKSREAMVISQLQPSGIVSEAVMAAYRATPRENYVPTDLRGVCYLDDDVALPRGRCLMEPLILGKMVQDASLTKDDKVLDIGGATGYSAAILARLAGNVIALEQDEKMLEQAQAQWNSEGLTNITAIVGDHAAGYGAQAPYRIIIVNGAVANIPEALVHKQLAVGGKLYCVVQPHPDYVGVITVVHKTSAEVWGTRLLGNAATLYTPGFAPIEKFTF